MAPLANPGIASNRNGNLFTSSDGSINIDGGPAPGQIDFRTASAGGGGGLAATVVSFANLALNGAAVVDGVALSTGQVVLAIAQADPTQNGPWIVNTVGAWTRHPSFTTAGQMVPGFAVRVLGGSAQNAGTAWTFTTPPPITVGATALTFIENPGSGVLAGLTQSQGRLALYPQYFAQVVGPSIQTLTLAGLNGTADGGYALEMGIVNGHAGGVFFMQVGGLGGASYYGTLSSFTIGAVNVVASDRWPLTNGGVTGAPWAFSGVMSTAPGLTRQISLQGWLNTGTPQTLLLVGLSTDLSSPVVTINLSSNQVDGLAAGTFIKATALGRT